MICIFSLVTGCINSNFLACKLIPPSGLERGEPYFKSPFIEVPFLDNYLLLEIDLETGRHHQIRAQLSKNETPIKGDLKYGSPRSNPDGGIHLHARKLEFIHPVTKENIEIIAPVPQNDAVWRACEE